MNSYYYRFRMYHGWKAKCTAVLIVRKSWILNSKALRSLRLFELFARRSDLFSIFLILNGVRVLYFWFYILKRKKFRWPFLLNSFTLNIFTVIALNHSRGIISKTWLILFFKPCSTIKREQYANIIATLSIEQNIDRSRYNKKIWSN